MSDLFTLLSAITGRIAASLDLQLAKAEGERTMQHPAANPDAVDLRFRAMALYISGITPEHTLSARRLLEQSVQLDPSSAESWAWLADLLASDYLNRWNGAGEEQLDRAEDATRKALALDPDMYLAYFARGFVHRASGENAAALRDFDEAIRLNPNFAHGYVQKANELINLGRPDQAPSLVETAISLSPRDPGLGVFYWNIGRAHFFAAKYVEAIPWLQKAVDARPNLWYNWTYLISAQALVGRLDRAREEMTKFKSDQHFVNQAFTISHIKKLELAVPSTNPVILQGREKFHQGLKIAGMDEE
jgi:adenylate cyclase